MGQAEIERAIKASLWRRADLTYKLREHQLPIYQHIAKGGPGEEPATITVCNVSRQTGKSFVAILYAVEHCLKVKNAHVQCLSATGKMMRTILVPALKKILEDCPDDLAPIPTAADGSWTFPSTGAVLRFDGCDNDNAENLRGRSSTLVIFDEAGFIDDLRYVLHDIILPQFIVTKGRCVVISTPPETPDHYFKALCDEATIDGTLLTRDVYLNGFASPEDIKKWMKEAGGPDSTTWKREYLCLFVVDAARSVIPEFTEEKKRILVQPVLPAGPNHKCVGMDVGFKDATAVVFGYYDFRSAKFMVQRELMLRGKEVRTDLIAQSIRTIEGQIWGDEPSFRVSDVELILLNDLQSIHQLNFRPVGKESKEAMINELRLWIQGDRIQIDPCCTRLTSQLQNAIWNKQRTQFERDADGHYDLVDALTYLIRTLPSVIPLNPYPKFDPTVTRATHVIFDDKRDQDPDVNEFEKLFTPVGEADDEGFESLFR